MEFFSVWYSLKLYLEMKSADFQTAFLWQDLHTVELSISKQDLNSIALYRRRSMVHKWSVRRTFLFVISICIENKIRIFIFYSLYILYFHSCLKYSWPTLYRAYSVRVEMVILNNYIKNSSKEISPRFLPHWAWWGKTFHFSVSV